MLTKRNALLAAGAAVLVALAGERAASASDSNWQVDNNGHVPWDAIDGGYDTNSDVLYFCRAYFGSSGYQPGKVSNDLGSCHYSYGGAEYSHYTGYEVLVPHWESAANGGVPTGSYYAGIDTDSAPLYPCRAYYGGGLHPGKLKEGAGCYIGWGGNEILLKNYDVLQGDLPLTQKGNDLFGGYIIGGFEANQNFSLELCVANYNPTTVPVPVYSTQPGKVVSDGSCHFSYGGSEHSTSDFSLIWLQDKALGNFFSPPAFDFVVGQDTDGQPLYACATSIRNDNDGSEQLGKYRQDFAGCHVGWGGQEVTGDNSQVIVDGIGVQY